VTDTASLILPGTAEHMTWRIGDHGFEMFVGPRVPGLIARHAPPWIGAWLDRQGLAKGDVASWAIHPGGMRILSELGEALGLDGEALAASREVLAEHGNMSSATLLFVLARLRRADAPRPCVALAFGPGLVAEGALIR
jgi:predicted naringenin-chalcone synthase